MTKKGEFAGILADINHPQRCLYEVEDFRTSH